MTFAVPIGNDVMDFQSRRCPAMYALLVITFTRKPALLLPFLVVWSHLAATPQVATLATVGYRNSLIATSLTARNFLGAQCCGDWRTANNTSLSNNMAFTPSPSEITGRGAIPTRARFDAVLGNIESLAALLTLFLNAVLAAGHRMTATLVPRDSRDGSAAIDRTILSIAASIKYNAALFADMLNLSHSLIIPQVWVNP